MTLFDDFLGPVVVTILITGASQQRLMIAPHNDSLHPLRITNSRSTSFPNPQPNKR